MGRSKHDTFWNHVEIREDLMICNFCGKELRGKPSISRIKSHLSGVTGRGIEICKKVPDWVRVNAGEAIQDVESNKRRKTMPSSSYLRQPANQVHNPEGIELMPFQIQGIGHHVEVENLTQDNGGQAMQPIDTRGETLLTTELVGKEFEKYMEEICDCLLKGRVSRIGIYGMGGVGKTELAKHLNNRLLETPNSFYHVCWVTVSPFLDICKLQNVTAKAVDLNLSGVDDEHIRAAKLSKALNKSKKFVLFLDDVWDYIPLNKTGIPVGLNGCKLILTTRSLEVCRKMDCQRNIKVRPLSKDEGRKLFKETLDNETLPQGVERIAESIADRCGGLPLGIEVMARNMKGVNDIHQWRDALYKLESAIPRKDNLEIFQKLKLSYDYLNDSALQQCFLYCALFPHSTNKESLIQYLIDEEVIKGESKEAELDEGWTMLNRLESVCLLEHFYYMDMHYLIRDMAVQIMGRNEVMVKVSRNLVKIPDVKKWGMDLVKVSLVNSNIKEIPPGHSPRCPNLSTLLLSENWQLRRIADSFFEQLNGLKILDLSGTAIDELPSSISQLVNLNALVLCQCNNLKQVPSLALLKKLKKLDLFCCEKVENVPQGMKMLSNLRYLDLRSTEMKELPIGMFENLSHLQVLLLPDLLKVKSKELKSLRNLEILKCSFLDIGEFNTFITTSKCFFNLDNYTLNVGGIILFPLFQLWEFIVKRYVCFTSQDFCKDALHLPHGAEKVQFNNCNIKKSLCFKNVVEILKMLGIRNCTGVECLFSGEDDVASSTTIQLSVSVSVSPSHYTFSLLRDLIISGCPSMKKLFPAGLLSKFQNLETLEVESCGEIEVIFATEEGQESHESNNDTQISLPKLKRFALTKLPQLKSICRGNIICDSIEKITVVRCEKLKRMPLSKFQNLETLEVKSCGEIAEIFATEEGPERHESNNDTQIFLPKLVRFALKKLPQLKSICRGNIICDSIEEITVVHCEKLKRMPISKFQNLEQLEVESCDEIEEIFATEEGQESHESNNNTQISLPKVKFFALTKLPQLKSICRGNIICDSIEEITVVNCEKLKRIPLSLVLMENDQLSPLPSLETIQIFPEEWWWESVELVHPNAKDLLLPFITFPYMEEVENDSEDSEDEDDSHDNKDDEDDSHDSENDGLL